MPFVVNVEQSLRIGSTEYRVISARQDLMNGGFAIHAPDTPRHDVNIAQVGLSRFIVISWNISLSKKQSE